MAEEKELHLSLQESSGSGGGGVSSPRWQRYSRDGDEDSEEMDVYNARVAQSVRQYLASGLEEVSPTDAIAPVVEVAGSDDQGDEEDGSLQLFLNGISDEALRSQYTRMHHAFIDALYDAIALEMNLVEAEEDAAVLERAVEQRDESIELMKLQLTEADEYNDALQQEKKEALRKLSEAKGELALLSQRTAKLSRELESRDEEQRQSTASSPLGPPLSNPTRRDAGTITTAELLASLPTATESTSKVRLASLQSALDEAKALLQKTVSTLESTRQAKTLVEEQLQEARLCDAARRKDNTAEMLLVQRCEESERYAALLEEEIRHLKEELQQRRGSEGNSVNASAIGGPASQWTSPATSAAPLKAEESQNSSINVTHISTNRPPASQEVQVSVLKRQLTRHQSEMQRLEKELHYEREKSQRHNATEKTLLENITYLTRQLRAREAVGRENRSTRRVEVSSAREQDDDVLMKTRPTVLERFSDPSHHSGDGATPGTACSSAHRSREESKPNPTRTSSPELRRRRDSIFAALKEARRFNEERHRAKAESSPQAEEEDTTRSTATAVQPRSSPTPTASSTAQNRTSVKVVRQPPFQGTDGQQPTTSPSSRQNTPHRRETDDRRLTRSSTPSRGGGRPSTGSTTVLSPRVSRGATATPATTSTSPSAAAAAGADVSAPKEASGQVSRRTSSAAPGHSRPTFSEPEAAEDAYNANGSLSHAKRRPPPERRCSSSARRLGPRRSSQPSMVVSSHRIQREPVEKVPAAGQNSSSNGNTNPSNTTAVRGGGGSGGVVGAPAVAATTTTVGSSSAVRHLYFSLSASPPALGATVRGHGAGGSSLSMPSTAGDSGPSCGATRVERATRVD